MSATKNEMKLVFKVERETKRTVRFQEESEHEDDQTIGTLYVSKRALRDLGNEGGVKDLEVTLSVAKD